MVPVQYKGMQYGVWLNSLLFLSIIGLAIPCTAQEMKLDSSSIRKFADPVAGSTLIRMEIVTTGHRHPLALGRLVLRIGKTKSGDGPVVIHYGAADGAFSNASVIDSFVVATGFTAIMVDQQLLEGPNYFWIRSRRQVKVDSFELGREVYRQVWSDEFEGDTINSSNWSFEKGFVRNNELQWYQEPNAHCANGILTIEAKKVKQTNPRYDPESKDWRRNRHMIEYTSASLFTKGKRSWQYGRFEMRARIDTVSGYWPAWWTLGNQNNWPSNGEIDIMEYYRGRVLANYAVGTDKPSTPVWFSRTRPVAAMGVPWKDSFHVWRMDWDERGIAIFLDDVLMNYQPQSNLYNRDGSGFYPFRQPHYMMLNLAIGGANGGAPDPSGFPLKYEIDYVRVAQKIKGAFANALTYPAGREPKAIEKQH